MQVHWQHNGSKIIDNSTDQYTITEVPDENLTLFTLNITGIVEDDRGIYNIWAHNSGGRLRATEMTELVIGKPHTCTICQ